MTAPIPKTWQRGEWVTHETLNTEVRDVFQWILNKLESFTPTIARMGVTLKRASSQAVSIGVPAIVSWDTEDDDTDDMWSAANPTTITIPNDGQTHLWAITANVELGATSTNRAFVQIVPSLGSHHPQIRMSLTSAGEDIGAATVVTPLPPGSTFRVEVFWVAAAPTTFTATLTCYRVIG